MTAKEIITGMPAKIRPEVIEGLNTLFHFDISGDEGGQYSVKIADGKCEVTEGLIGEPTCKVTSSDKNLVGIINGSINGPMAVMMPGMGTVNWLWKVFTWFGGMIKGPSVMVKPCSSSGSMAITVRPPVYLAGADARQVATRARPGNRARRWHPPP